MEPSDKVEDMKKKIKSKEKIAIDRQEIMYRDVVLKDEVTLSEYGLETVSNLDLTARAGRSECAIQ